MSSTAESRRQFLATFSGLGLGGTLLPGVLWAKMEEQSAHAITSEMLKASAAIAGLEFPDDELATMLQAVNQNLGRYQALHELHIPNNVAPPFYFSPLVPGMKVNRNKAPLKFSKITDVTRPANLEDVAFWPVTHLSHLLKTKQVTSVELTQMYLDRLHRYNPKLNCVVTFLDDVALAQATPDGEKGRYTMSPITDGVIRLDTRTGAVSTCNTGDAGWACRVVPDCRLPASSLRISAAPAARWSWRWSSSPRRAT